MRQTRVAKGCAFGKREFFCGIVLGFGLCPAANGLQAAVAPASAVSIVADRNDLVVRFAAEQLQRYLRDITNEAIEIGSPRAKHHIYIGETPPNIPGSLRDELHAQVGALLEDGFVIRSIGPDIVILGKGP